MSCAVINDTTVISSQTIAQLSLPRLQDCCDACFQHACQAAVFTEGVCSLYGPIDDVMSAPGYFTLIPNSPQPTSPPTGSLTPSVTAAPPRTSGGVNEDFILIIVGSLVLLVFVVFLARTVNWSKCFHNPFASRRETRYRMERLLGEGTYGCVFLATRLSDKKKLALKYIPCEAPRDVADAYREYKSLEAVKGHPNLVNLVEAFAHWDDEHLGDPCLDDIPRDMIMQSIDRDELTILMDRCSLRMSDWGYFCIVTDYYAEGTMYQLLTRRRTERLSERSILRYTEQICEAVEYIHKCDLIHRDLKPGNLLMCDGMKKIVITDFGLTRELEAGAYAHTRAGTLHYFAPEQAQRRYTNKADVWAIGCLIYAMSTRRITKVEARTMFLDRLRPDFEETILGDLAKESYSPELGMLILKLLCQSPHDRPAATEALAHVRELLKTKT